MNAGIEDRMTRRTVLGLAVGAGTVLAASRIGAGEIRARQSTEACTNEKEQHTMSSGTPTSGTPTVALIHGAFADSSSWAGVVERLQADGVPVVAIVNPLRGLAYDTAYVASAINQIQGPVLVVAHSYGGAVISNACATTPNTVGLVFVAAFAPEIGENLLQIEGESRDSVLSSALVEEMYPAGEGGEPAVEYVISAGMFHAAFAADLPAKQAAVMQATQRPAAQACFSEQATAAAWKNLPAWAVIATNDRAAGTDVVRDMAKRAQADATEIAGSHVIMVSQPQAVTEVIRRALAATA